MHVQVWVAFPLIAGGDTYIVETETEPNKEITEEDEELKLEAGVVRSRLEAAILLTWSPDQNHACASL